MLHAIHEHERVLRNSLLLMRIAQVLELPVVLTTQYRKGLGETVPEVLAAAPGALPLDKVSFGCFGDAAIDARIAALGRSQLVVCGIEAHICVMQTVLGARERGLEVHVASDAVGSRAESNRQVGLHRMERAGRCCRVPRWRCTSCWRAATARRSSKCCRSSRAERRDLLPEPVAGPLPGALGRGAHPHRQER